MNPNQQAAFAPVPDSDDLAAMERRLRFIPSNHTAPLTLTAEQVKHYNSRGFISEIPIFRSDEIVRIRTEFDSILDETLKSGGNSYSISTAHRKYGLAWDLLTEPRIVACVKDLLGENVIGWGSPFFCKMPGDGKTVS